MVRCVPPFLKAIPLRRCLAAVLVSVTALVHTAAAAPWPEGLREAVTSHFQALQVREYLVRDSTLSDPRGVQPMTAFDRASHKCHEVPGQVYRVYRVPARFSAGGDGSYLLRSKFDLYFRQAERIEEIFHRPWGEGSDGAIEVRFERVGGNWEAVKSRELLDLDN